MSWLAILIYFQEIYKDRKKFSKQVFDVASSDLVNMGICVVSYTLKDIRDEEVIIAFIFQNVFSKLKIKRSADTTVKSRLSERRLSETTGLFEDDGQSRIFSLLSIAIKLPIIRISIIRKIQFSEVIRRSQLKKMLLNYPSRFEVQKSRMVIMISLFGRVRFTHLSELANKVATGN